MLTWDVQTDAAGMPKHVKRPDAEATELSVKAFMCERHPRRSAAYPRRVDAPEIEEQSVGRRAHRIEDVLPRCRSASRGH